MLQKITAFFAKYNISKHTIVVAYGVLFTLFQTNTDFKNYALSIYGDFPHWLSALVVGLIVPLITFYHLGTRASTAASNALKSTAVAALGLIMLVGLAGCTPESTNTAVKDIVAYLPTVQALADTGMSIDQLFDPSSASTAASVETTINNGIASLTTIANAYLAQPTSTNWQSVVNAVNALVASADSQLLAASKITNPTSQAKATAILGAIDLAVHALDAFVQKAQPTATVQATAASRTVKLKTLSVYWPSNRMTPEMYGELKTSEAMGF